jgi:SAM-dependent methyltransferase
MGPPQFSLLDIVAGRWRADALAALARLGVAEAMAAGPRTAAELAAELQLDPDALHRVLRALAREGLLDEDGARFALNAYTRPLLRDHPNSLRNMVMEIAAPQNTACWARLPDAIRTGEATWQAAHGGEHMWEWLERHPEAHTVFHEAMRELTREGAPSFARAYPFGDHDSVVDLGGGTGQLLATILAVNPRLAGVLVDAPAVVAGAGPVLRAMGVEGRCEVIGGDILADPVPAGKGVYLAKNITHGLSDAHLAAPLGRWRTAMRPDSRLVLVDVVVPEAPAPYFGFLDLQMLLVSFGGRERTEREFAALFAANGLTLERVIPTASPMSLIVARRAAPL